MTKSVLFFSILLVFFQGFAQITVEGTAQNVITVGNNIPWWYLDSGTLEDGNPIQTEVCGDPSADLMLTDFGFDIPSTAVIEGITLTLIKSATDVVYDQTISLYLNDNILGENKADNELWSQDYTSMDYGNITDLWSTMLSAANINDTGFGVFINTSPAVIYCLNANIDLVKLSITYTDALSTNQSAFTDGFSLFPNPAEDILTIQSEFPIESLSIYSITGDLVFANDKAIGNTSIPIQNLASGVYFLKAIAKEASVVKKFVKQ